MKKRFTMKSRTVMRLLSIAVIASFLPSGFAWGLNQPPLSRIPVPVPRSNSELLQPQFSGPNGLAAFVKDVPAAIALGKALFWDMQAGSDGATACASCHYGAGADPIATFKHTRARNQLHPGPDTVFGNNDTVINTFVTTIDPVTLIETDTPVILPAAVNPRFKPNYELSLDILGDFPLFRVIPAEARLAIDPLTGLTGDAIIALSDTNDVIGSQGIRLADFLAINNNSAVDAGTALADPIFNTGTAPNTDPLSRVRQVTGRNTPSVINAVFNFTNFWDGRANNIFNGVNPLGPLDVNARIWVNNNGTLEQQQIAIPNSSLASQAVGPPLSDVEMSFKGRTFPELGRKMLSLTRPLDQQFVHPSDSVLGSLSRATLELDGTLGGNRGLGTNYQQMIQNAFLDNYWNSVNTVQLPTKASPAGENFSQMEANFSLFWGLAIQLYEATLVSDQAPFDRFQSGNRNALSAAAQRGFATFDSKCTVCHTGAEFTSAAIGSNISPCLTPDCNSPVFTSNASHTLIKQEVNPDTFAFSVTDTGFFNIGIRPTADNIGRGAGEPEFPFPLSFTRLARMTGLPFATPVISPLVAPTTPDILNGSFKTPGLRNVELTPPYFHNGTALTLDHVVELYTRGGNFPGNPELATAMQPIGNLRNDPARRSEIVEFMKSLTDERVRNESAPFDHPELIIPNGVDDLSGAEIPITLAATGGAPAAEAPAVLILNPVSSPAILTSQLLSGTVDTNATVAISLNNGTQFNATVACVLDPVLLECLPTADVTSSWSATVTGMPIGLNSIRVIATSPTGGTREVTANISVMPAATISGTPLSGKTKLNNATLTVGGTGVTSYQYSLDNGPFSADTPISTPISLTGLIDGTHRVAVIGKDDLGNQQPDALATTATWAIKATPPVLTMDDQTLNAIGLPTGNSSLTISGTVDLGLVPLVSANLPARAGLVSTVAVAGITTWSCDITGLASGDNAITITAQDFIPNITTINGVITRVLRDGNFKGTGSVDITDALKALRFTVDLETPTPTDMIHGDVAPLVNGLPSQNNRIDIADALLILRKIVGLVTF